MKPSRSTLLNISALSAALAIAGSANAKDQFKWDGFYAGAQVSYSQANGQWGLGELNDDFLDLTGSGGGAGLLAGYAFRVDDFVLGVEGDVNLESLKADNGFALGDDDDPFFIGKSSSDRLNAMGSVRVKAGLPGEFPFIGETLLYGTVGVAFGRWKTNSAFEVSIDSDPPLQIVASGQKSGWRTGLQFGGGVEIPMADQLSLKFEVIHTDYEADTLLLIPTVGDDALPIPIDQRVTSARIGLNWRF